MNDDLAARLRMLEGAGLIRRAASDAEPEYAFRHVLSLEAAYASMLKQDRRRLHLDVGECLERVFADSVDEVAPILARHFDEAGDDARALAYLSRAADSASRRYATQEAIMLLDRALAIALRGDASASTLSDLCVRSGRLREMSGDYDAALRVYDQLEELAGARADTGMRGKADLARAAVFCVPTSRFDAARGLAIAERALALARETGDRTAECKAQWLILLAHRWMGKPDLAEEAGLASAAIAEELGLREQLAYTLNDLGLIYIMTGRTATAIDIYKQAEDLWRKLDQLPLLADNLTNLGYLSLYLRGPTAASPALVEAERISDMIGNVWGQSYCRTIRSQSLVFAGRYDEAVSLSETAMALAKQAGFAIPQILMPIVTAWAHADFGLPARGAAICRQALATARDLVPTWQGNPAVSAAICDIQTGDRAAADAAMATARELASGNDGSTMLLGMAEVEYARLTAMAEDVLDKANIAESLLQAGMGHAYLPLLWGQRAEALLRLGRADEAETVAGDAVALMNAQGTRAWAWRLGDVRWRIAAARGDSKQEVERLHQARVEVEFMAEHALSEETRQAFLHLPEVMQIRGKS